MMGKIIKLSLLLCILVNSIIVKETFSENRNTVAFENISIEKGLSSGYVTSIFQDSKGYMWIATSDGLNRYDGDKTKVYNCNIDNKNSLSSTYITSLEEDQYGNIWVGTDAGLDIIYRENDNIVNFKNNVANEYDLSDSKISSLLRTNNNGKDIMWIGANYGLVKVYLDDFTTELYKYEKSNENSLTNSSITYLEEDEEKRLWIGTKAGLNVLDVNSNTIYKKNTKNYDRLFIYCIEKDKFGNMWIVTKDGILKYNANSDTIENFDINIEGSQINNFNFIMNDSDDNMWISSTSDGIIKYSKKGKLSSINHSSNIQKNTISSSVTYFYEDLNGLIWIGTDNGVNILNNNTQFNIIGRNSSSKGILSGSNITSVLNDNQGNLWVATKFNGINIVDKTGNLIKHLYHDPDDNSSLISNNIKYLMKMDDNYIAAITNKGISLFNTKDKTMTRYLIDDNYSYEFVYLYSDEDTVWGATTNGFFSYNIKTKEYNYHNSKFEKFEINPEYITYIHQDSKDKNILWLGGSDIGLIEYHKTEGVLTRYLNNRLDKNSLISNYINCIQSDELGNLWIGTNIGLSKFDTINKTFKSYTVSNGLSNNFINSILTDDSNNIWISTNKGLNKFNINEEEFINFTTMDGLGCDQFNLNSSLKYDKYMVFGGTNGITYFSPDSIEYPKKNEDKVVVGDIFVDDKKVKYNQNELVLDYNYKDVLFDYFLPNYKNLDNITYEYMLEGIDTQWIYEGNKSHVNYKALKPGKYAFKVRARSGNGNLTEVTSINIKVKNPVWKTPLAYFIYFIILLFIVIYIFNYVKILQKLVDQKTVTLNKQLEENKRLSKEIIDKEKFKNNYFVNLSHELRTPINVIMSTVQLISSININRNITYEKNKEYMSIIHKSCDSLLKIINDIIDSSKVETGQYKINKKNTDIVYLVEEAALNMSKFIEEKGISLIIDPDMEEQSIFCDETEIERCVINLLGNAVKFTPEGGEIRIYIKEINENIEIIVEDTGIGISKEDQEFIFKRFSQIEGTGATKASSSGIGLTLVKYVAELHGGYVKLESELNKGSKFTIGLPSITNEC